MGCRLWGRTESDTTEAIQQQQPWRLNGKKPICNAGDVRDKSSILEQENLLEEGTATHSSILAWRIP